jgi:hypothetical protein
MCIPVIWWTKRKWKKNTNITIITQEQTSDVAHLRDTNGDQECKEYVEYYESACGSRSIPPNYPYSCVQDVIAKWGVADRAVNRLPVLTWDTNSYTLDIRSGCVFPWLSTEHNTYYDTIWYLHSTHPGLGWNLSKLQNSTLWVNAESYALGVEVIYAYYHLVADNYDAIAQTHDIDISNMSDYNQYVVKYGRMESYSCDTDSRDITVA